jgi:glutamate synthase (ferredoxin)
VSADGRTGDGAGILLIFLMIFFKKKCDLLFQNERVCSRNFFYQKKTKLILQDDFETAIRNQNLNIIGWRDVPVDVSNLGQIAAEKNR